MPDRSALVVPGGMDVSVTREQWGDAFLQGLAAPITKRNRIVMLAWIASEGGDARWNALNTTQEEPGSTDYNSIGVKNYTSYGQGLTAAIATIRQPGKGYEAILFRLRRNRHSWWTLRAVYASRWGTVKLPFLLHSVKRSYRFYADQPVAS
jgi:hypothetical protein